MSTGWRIAKLWRTTSYMRRTSGSTHAPGEEDTWYDDVRAHREPAVETAGHSTSQVMRLRREAHQPRLSTAEKQTRECVAARLAPPPIKAPAGNAGFPQGSADAARETRRKEEWYPAAVATVLLSAHEIDGGGVGKPPATFPIPRKARNGLGGMARSFRAEREGEGGRMKRPFAECIAAIGRRCFAFLLFLFQLIGAALLLVPSFGANVSLARAERALNGAHGLFGCALLWCPSLSPLSHDYFPLSLICGFFLLSRPVVFVPWPDGGAL
ncbi:hypothetical protein TcBrA4_0046820 [Trypanosoma cruzi]|nr:hypothetical protein TcBrA4_0046820 [Trypanosoma cruzi]